MELPHALASAIASWSSYYGAHQLVSVTTRFLHLGSLVIGGGTAISADRAALRAGADWAARRADLVAALGAAHKVVVPALVVVVLTGALLTAADLDTFLNSRLFWVKMGVFAVLTVNGAGLMAAERAAANATPSARALVALVAFISLVSWTALLFLGTWLTVGA